VLLGFCLALAAFGARADELGTLFYTPQERARLDRLRRGEPVEHAANPGGIGAPRALTGFVQRSDGRTTVWIDGNPVTLAPRSAPKLDPKSVRAYSDDRDGVKVERKPAR
jgi:hypothetical protein